MKKIIGIGLILVLFIPLAGQESKPKPDYLFWTLAAANVAAGTWDMAMSLHRYRRGEISENNPVAKYMFDTCPWGIPFYMLATTGAVIGASYLINQLGWKPLGHILLGGILLGRGYVIYLNFRI